MAKTPPLDMLNFALSYYDEDKSWHLVISHDGNIVMEIDSLKGATEMPRTFLSEIKREMAQFSQSRD